MERSLHRPLGLATMALLLAWPTHGGAQNLVFRGLDFDTWNHPRGLVTVQPGGIAVKHFGKRSNAVANAGQFPPNPIGDFGRLPVRAPSNQGQARRVVDQDADTWWQPSTADPLQTWWLELDLGRDVVADRVRVIFPDTTGARPFSFFSVYVSPGIPVFGSSTPRIVFTRLGRPVNNNTSRVVEFALTTTGVPSATGENLVTGSTVDFDIVRFVRFEAAGMTPDAALAEIEVDEVGFNLATQVATRIRVADGTPTWGGRTWTSKDRDCDGCGKGAGADELLHQDLGFRGWNIEASDKGDWRDSGVWSVVDFGSVFRVDRVVWVPIVSGQGPFLYGYQRDKQGSWSSFEFLLSDGSPSNSADPVVEGPFEYELLSSVVNTGRYLFDFQFAPRSLRLLLWRMTKVQQFARAAQLFVYHAEGYPARVELESPDLPLGGARSLRRVEWDAEVPPNTRIEVETQTGNGFETRTRYFLANGDEVTKAAYDAAKARNRGEVVEEIVRDATWSNWSLPHRFAGQAFQSPSPRQWLRARVRLVSDDPEAMPALRSLTFVATPPVITAGLTGRIHPREAGVDTLQEFRYTIKPAAVSGADAGFDRVLIALPRGSGDAELVGVRVRGAPVAATGLVREDSLIVQLPPPVVRRDSVEVVFRARVYASPTVFTTAVVNSAQEGNVQGVVPADFGADQVFVPAAVDGAALVRNIAQTAILSPNRDGVNDEYRLSFTVVKTDREPRVRVYALSGRAVAELQSTDLGSGRARFVWDGRSGGTVVPPGLYIVRIEVDADARNESVQKVLHVAY